MKALCLHLAIAFALIAGNTFGQSTKPVTNADVVQMVKAGLTESLILNAIDANGFDFDISPSALLELSKSGVGQDLIEAMIAHVQRAKIPVKLTLREPSELPPPPEIKLPNLDLTKLGIPFHYPPSPVIIREGSGSGVRPNGSFYRVGAGVSAPQLIYRKEPLYSEQARKAKVQGVVILSIIVQKDGSVRDIWVVQPLGLGLDEQAIASVIQWRFRPGMKSGAPVDVLAKVEVTFRLK